MINDDGAATRADIAMARATIARLRAASEGDRWWYAEVADAWADALDELQDARALAVGGARAVDVLEQQGTRAVTMLRDFIELLPHDALALRRGKISRRGFPELFGGDDGDTMYMDEARRRILAKVQP